MVNVPVKELRGIAITMNKLEDVENLKKIRQMRLPFNQLKGITSMKKIRPPNHLL